MMKRKIQRMLVKAFCLSGILIALDMVSLDSWRMWLLVFSLAIGFDLDILFMDVDKEK